MSDVTIIFTDKMQELLNKALNDGLSFREGAFMQLEINKQLAPKLPKQILPVESAQ